MHQKYVHPLKMLRDKMQDSRESSKEKVEHYVQYFNSEFARRAT